MKMVKDNFENLNETSGKATSVYRLYRKDWEIK